MRGAGPIHLFFGMRHPDSDFLYGEELARLAGRRPPPRLVTTAFSRDAGPTTCRTPCAPTGAEVARLIRNGARVMVCGGRDMAAGVAEALADILAPSG